MEIEQGLMFPSVEYFVEHVMDAMTEGSSTVHVFCKANIQIINLTKYYQEIK